MEAHRRELKQVLNAVSNGLPSFDQAVKVEREMMGKVW